MLEPFLTRREFLKASAVGTLFACSPLNAAEKQTEITSKTILLRNGWQTVNIGDIAHTPGMLRLLERFLPETPVILWAHREPDRGVREMLLNRFPKLTIVGDPNGPTETQAFEQAAFLLYGSGPGINVRQLKMWSDTTGKPYGTCGNTYGSHFNPLRKSVLSGADFLLTRETHSLKRLQEGGVSGPVMDFVPDATFAFDLVNEPAGIDYLKKNQLTDGEFICVIPRLRKTPYYKIYETLDPSWTPEYIKEVDELNARWAEPDHAKAREAMIHWVRETGHKVLVCPEMTYQLEIMDELLIDPLPADVRPYVVKRDTFWLPDEAASVYQRARAILSFECHSPIISFVQGTPAFYLRQPEDTIKGQMWYDIGVPNWVFEIEESTGAQIAARLMEVHQDYDGAQKYLADAMKIVNSRMENAMTTLRKSLASIR